MCFCMKPRRCWDVWRKFLPSSCWFSPTNLSPPPLLLLSFPPLLFFLFFSFLPLLHLYFSSWSYCSSFASTSPPLLLSSPPFSVFPFSTFSKSSNNLSCPLPHLSSSGPAPCLCSPTFFPPTSFSPLLLSQAVAGLHSITSSAPPQLLMGPRKGRNFFMVENKVLFLTVIWTWLCSKVDSTIERWLRAASRWCVSN